ncbi:MAG TPA: hypothetical protein VFX22_12140, partial [Candidatus Kapabacteria bacterium]|nr:hypothetical protein [Candidatus Kapabacteria bacterium]
MKPILLFLSFFATSAAAQTITLGPITKLDYCVGDTMVVPYQASGTFAGDNYFVLQLSDSNGSFVNFTNIDNDTAKSGTFLLHATMRGSHFRIRIISADPYEVSPDNGNDISIFGIPTPSIQVRNETTGVTYSYYGDLVGLTGNQLTFFDAAKEISGSTYFWEYDSLNNKETSTDSLLHVTFSTDGPKKVFLRVTNPNGCSNITIAYYLIASCNPTIPPYAIVVTGTYAMDVSNEQDT